MSKRFTDDEKWRDAWFRRLKPGLKLVWLYLCDVCDTAGVWDSDFDVVRFDIGVRVGPVEALAAFNGRVEVMPCGKWRLVKFLSFQNPNGLTPASPAHRPIIALCEKHGIDWPRRREDGKGSDYPTPYPNVDQQGKDKGKGKGKGKGQDARAGGPDPEDLTTPLPTDGMPVRAKTERDVADQLGDVIHWRNAKDADQQRSNIVELALLVAKHGLKPVHEAGEVIRMRERRKAWVSEVADALLPPSDPKDARAEAARAIVRKHGWQACAAAAGIPEAAIGREGTMVEAMVAQGEVYDAVVAKLGGPA